MNYKEVEILSVNYNTPELIYRQYISIRKYISKTIKIRIIDGSDTGDQYFKDLIENDKNFDVNYIGFNIHHGAGMNYGIKNSKYKYQFILDSDVYIIKTGLLDLMLSKYTNNAYGVGHVVNVNKIGANVISGYRYLHPLCMLLTKTKYLLHKPFRNHGAPCIDTMLQLHEQNIPVIHIKNITNYYATEGRGTRIKNKGLNLPNKELQQKIINYEI